MYSVEPLFGNQWAVIGECGQTACTGTMRQCEDFLDFQENRRMASLAAARARPSARSSRTFPKVLAWTTTIALGLYCLSLLGAGVN